MMFTVGESGSVRSVDISSEQTTIAESNYDRWRRSYAISRGQPWHDNVTFTTGDLAAYGTDADSYDLVRSPMSLIFTVSCYVFTDIMLCIAKHDL